MQKRRRVNELDRGRELDVAVARVAELACGGERDQRAQALAAGIDEMRGQLRNERRLAEKAGMNGGIGLDEIAGNELRQSLDRVRGLIRRACF